MSLKQVLLFHCSASLTGCRLLDRKPFLKKSVKAGYKRSTFMLQISNSFVKTLIP